MPPSEVRRESERAELVVKVVVGGVDWFRRGLLVGEAGLGYGEGRGGEAYHFVFGLVWFGSDLVGLYSVENVFGCGGWSRSKQEMSLTGD